jgi:hypothetical protein
MIVPTSAFRALSRTAILSNERTQRAAESGGEGSCWSYARWTERPADRARRVSRKRVDAATAAAIRLAFNL